MTSDSYSEFLFVPRKRVLVATDREILSRLAAKTKLLPLVGNRSPFVRYVVNYFTG